MNWKTILYWLLPSKTKIIIGKNATGALKHIKDDRDYVSSVDSSFILPQSFSLRNNSNLTAVENQGGYNSCVTQAITTAIETYSLNKEWKHPFELSRMYLWHYGRKLSGTFPENKGMYIRDGWKVAQGDDGVTIEKLYPYSTNFFNVEPGLAARAFRKWHPPFAYYWIFGTAEQLENGIKNALFYNKVPIVFAAPLAKSFFNPTITAVYKPIDNEKLEFRHAMLITGWDDTANCFEIMNSWGTHWGNSGFLRVDKNWLLNKADSFSYPGDIND